MGGLPRPPHVMLGPAGAYVTWFLCGFHMNVHVFTCCLFVFLLANGTCFSMVQCQKVQVLGTK